MQHGGPRYVKVNLELTIHASLVVPSLLPRPLFAPNGTNEGPEKGESERGTVRGIDAITSFDKKEYLVFE